MSEIENFSSYLALGGKYEHERNYAESFYWYKKGVEIMTYIYPNVLGTLPRMKFLYRLNWYIERTRAVQCVMLEEQPSSMHKIIHINDGETGKGYNRIFAPYFDCLVTVVKIYEPHLRSLYQIAFLKHLLELVLNKCKNVKEIYVVTSRNLLNSTIQSDEFKRMRGFLPLIKFRITYSETSHERAILLDNGWIIKIGRGLNYFYDLPNWIEGFFDLNDRPCRDTNISISYNSVLHMGVQFFDGALETEFSGTPEGYLYNVFLMESGLYEPGLTPDSLTPTQRETVASVFRSFIARCMPPRIGIASVGTSAEGTPIIVTEQNETPAIERGQTGTTPVIIEEQTGTPMAIHVIPGEQAETHIVQTEETENLCSQNREHSTRKKKKVVNIPLKSSSVITRSQARNLAPIITRSKAKALKQGLKNY